MKGFSSSVNIKKENNMQRSMVYSFFAFLMYPVTMSGIINSYLRFRSVYQSGILSKHESLHNTYVRNDLKLNGDEFHASHMGYLPCPVGLAIMVYGQFTYTMFR